MAIKVSNTTVIDNSRNILNVGTISASGNSTFSGTGSLTIPSGTEAQRPGSPSTGMIRFNTDSASLEVYNGATSSWASAGGGGGGVSGTVGSFAYFTSSF